MSNIERARRSLNDHYQQSLERRIVLLEGWLADFDPTDAQQVTSIRREGHQLRGTGASFGFPAITECGGAVEDATVDDLPAALAALVAEVHRALDDLRNQRHAEPI